MTHRKPLPALDCQAQDKLNELRLEDAERRVVVVFDRAALVYAIITKRDNENRWQDSVNRLFEGGPI